eukprot:270321_1
MATAAYRPKTKSALSKMGNTRAIEYCIPDSENASEIKQALMQYGIVNKKKLIDHLFDKQNNIYDVPDLEGMESVATALEQAPTRGHSRRRMSVMKRQRAVITARAALRDISNEDTGTSNTNNDTKTASKYSPDNTLNVSLRNGKVPFESNDGMCMIEYKYIHEFVALLQRLSTIINHAPTNLKTCRCDDVILNGYNPSSTALTTMVDICCSCHMKYGTFLFGGKFKGQDGRLYHENSIRFALLTQDIKENFNLGEKWQIHFGIKNMCRNTFDRARDYVDEIVTKKGEEYIEDALQQAIGEQKDDETTHISGDGAWVHRKNSKQGIMSIVDSTDVTIDTFILYTTSCITFK